MALTPGTRLGVYEIAAQIGEGGMGESIARAIRLAPWGCVGATTVSKSAILAHFHDPDTIVGEFRNWLIDV